MRQILYVSTSTAANGKAEVGAIVEQSRHNNAIDGITGLLWTDGARFLQVLEGPEDSVESTFARIGRDRRHREVTVMLDRTIDAREFGGWSMAQRFKGDSAEGFDARVRRLLLGASEEVREPFLDLVAEE